MEHRETEFKLRVDRPALLRKRLASIGATLVSPRHFEDNYILDFPDGRLRRSDSLLRVRMAGDKASLTFKGPARVASGIKSRLELETPVEKGLTSLRILESLGFRCAFRYQKYRTIYRRGSVWITLDQTPIGMFAEMEGPRRDIARVARDLGFNRESFITDTYADLYRKYLSGGRSKSKNMLLKI